MKMIWNSPYGLQRQLNFSNVFSDINKWNEYFNEICVKNMNYPSREQTAKNINTLYYLLYGEYGNSTFSGSDINQAIYKLFGIVYKYGPTWEKEIETQDKLRRLTDEELEMGVTSIFNQAANNGGQPTTQNIEELLGIDNQTVSKYKKDKIRKYLDLELVIKRDVTNDFLIKFRVLFKKITATIEPLFYETEE